MIENVTWNVAVIGSVGATNEYDKKTAQILKKLQTIGIDAHTVKIIPAGRAIQIYVSISNISHYMDPAKENR